MLSNLVAALFLRERIKTTQAKAKAAKPLAERLISFAKKGDLAARRRVLKVLPDQAVVQKLFTTLAPRYAERNGGYIRLYKLKNRLGDAAPLTLMELVGATLPSKVEKK